MQNRFMRRLLVLVLLCGVGALVWLSLHLAAFCIYQVDECTESYVARIVAAKQAGTHSPGHVTLFQILLSTVLHGSSPSADLLTSGRFLMLGIFWLNWVLIALATRERLFSLGGLPRCLGRLPWRRCGITDLRFGTTISS